jgi:ketosteroid isomerase-like protein
MPSGRAETETTILQQQDDFHSALLRGDAAVLESMVADDCRIIGPKSFFIDRAEWIGTHEAGNYEQVRLESREIELRVHGDTAIRWEVQDSSCRYNGEAIDGLFRVTEVWIRQPDRWRLASLQYTSLTAR